MTSVTNQNMTQHCTSCFATSEVRSAYSTVASPWESLLQVNTSVDNIGARRLHTVLERIVEDISFDAPEKVRLMAQQPLLAQTIASCSTYWHAPS